MGWVFIVAIIIGTPVMIVYAIVKRFRTRAALNRWRREWETRENEEKRTREINAQEYRKEQEEKAMRLYEHYSATRESDIYGLARREHVFKDVSILGVEDVLDEDELSDLKVPHHLHLMLYEYDERFDKAVIVKLDGEDGRLRHLGHLDLDDPVRDIVFDWLNKDYIVNASISAIEGTEVKINIALHRPLSEEYNTVKRIRLKGTKESGVQYQIKNSYEDDAVEIRYDSSQARYHAYCGGGSIGYLPEEYNEIFDEVDKFEAYICERGLTRKSKFYVCIAVFYNDKKLLVKKCSSCGANNSIKSGKSNACEYCGAPLES